MATIGDIIENTRVELYDDADDWSDEKMLVLAKKAIRRVNHILFQLGVRIGKSQQSFNTVVGTSLYALPSDFMAPDALYRTDTDERLEFLSDDTWLRVPDVSSSSQCLWWRIDPLNSNIEIAGTPDEVIAMQFLYWPRLDTSAYTALTAMPWLGYFDEAIEDYLALRCKNTDEMTIAQDLQLAGELEKRVMLVMDSWSPDGGTMESAYLVE